ncbi:MAG: TonB-dependent receptor plug [Ferruginibacter sp.]|nr:TonB-dependent receptor plug [Ferruginibacter sp.]
MRFTPVFIAIFLSAFCFASTCGQYIFKGRVQSSEDKKGLTGVTVLADTNAVALTDSNGVFEFSSSKEKSTISFSHIGYQAVSGKYSAGQFIGIVLYSAHSFLSEIVVKAYERNTSLINMPVTVSVLGRNDLERYGNTSILPAVNIIPGVKMDERSPGSYRLSIRGNLLRSPFGVRNVKVYWNGIPFTDANGNTYLNQLGFENVGKIEIIKGPGGSMYGAGTGGVVLLSSRNAGYKENSISINTLGGSYGLEATNIAYRSETDNANYSLQYSHQQTDGWRDQTSTRKDVANYTGSFNINPKQTIHTNIFYSDLYYQTPGGLTIAQLNANPRQSRPAAGTFRSATAQKAALFVKTFYAGFAHDYQFSPMWSNSTNVYTSNTRFRNPSILNYQRKTEQGIGGRTVTQYHNNNVQIHFGGEYQYGFTSTRTFGNQSGVPDTLQFDDEIAATQYNIFLQTDITLGENFIINAGGSYNNYGYGFTRLNNRPVNEIHKTFDPVFVPRISLLQKFGAGNSLYVTVSKGYSPPTIDEIVPSTGIFNATLNAEKATNYELGFRSELIKNVLFVDAAAYLFRLNNTIVTRRDAAGADFFVNTGKTDQRGVELSVNYYPVRNSIHFLQELKLWGNYTYIKARFKTYQQLTSDFSGNKLTGTPPNVLVMGADAITKIGLYANLTYSYTDQIPLNDANSFFATQYNLLFSRIGYKMGLGKKTSGEIYLSYDHSFNEPYSLGNDLNAAGNRFFNPSAPQNFQAGVKVQFGL